MKKFIFILIASFSLYSFSQIINANSGELIKQEDVLSNFNYLKKYYSLRSKSLNDLTLSENIKSNEINELFENLNNNLDSPVLLNTFFSNNYINANLLNENFTSIKNSIISEINLSVSPYSSSNFGLKYSTKNVLNKILYLNTSFLNLTEFNVTNSFGNTIEVFNEFIKVKVNNRHGTDLVQISGVNDLGQTINYKFYFSVTYTEAWTTNSISRIGSCSSQSGAYASSTSRNYFACQDGDSGFYNDCDRYYYAGTLRYSGTNTKTAGQTIWNIYNTNQDHIYVDAGQNSGDLRSGCSGDYVYAFRLKYKYRNFYLQGQNL